MDLRSAQGRSVIARSDHGLSANMVPGRAHLDMSRGPGETPIRNMKGGLLITYPTNADCVMVAGCLAGIVVFVARRESGEMLGSAWSPRALRQDIAASLSCKLGEVNIEDRPGSRGVEITSGQSSQFQAPVTSGFARHNWRPSSRS
jgi:hypothetical protein